MKRQASWRGLVGTTAISASTGSGSFARARSDQFEQSVAPFGRTLLLARQVVAPARERGLFVGLVSDPVDGVDLPPRDDVDVGATVSLLAPVDHDLSHGKLVANGLGDALTRGDRVFRDRL
jgi:hypothetical protein